MLHNVDFSFADWTLRQADSACSRNAGRQLWLEASVLACISQCERCTNQAQNSSPIHQSALLLYVVDSRLAGLWLSLSETMVNLLHLPMACACDEANLVCRHASYAALPSVKHSARRIPTSSLCHQKSTPCPMAPQEHRAAENPPARRAKRSK